MDAFDVVLCIYRIILYTEFNFITEMSILLTLSVYQLTVSNQLPNKSGAIPLIGWYNIY